MYFFPIYFLVKPFAASLGNEGDPHYLHNLLCLVPEAVLLLVFIVVHIYIYEFRN